MTGGAVYTHPSFLHTLSDHHHVVDVLLPNHLPEIIFSSRQRTLRGDVLPPEVIPLKHIINTVDGADGGDGKATS